ncbi:hypothetical protein DL89DRAFT_265566, partial [Linderina pennispora]
MNIAVLLALIVTSRASGTTTTTRGIDDTQPTLQPADVTAPIWYNRQPAFTTDDRQQTNYLLCKMAHNGRDQWAETTGPDVSRLPLFGGVKPPQKVCSQCFCLPNTQRVLRKAMAPRLSKRSSQDMPESNSMRVRAPGLYVNYEACVRANHSRVFLRGCNRCVCRQDGVVMCTNKVCTRSVLAVDPSSRGRIASLKWIPLAHNPTPETSNMGSKFRTNNVRLSGALTYDTYEQCLDAHDGSRTFYADCNLCICGYDGEVACTMKNCPHPPPLPHISSNIPISTEQPRTRDPPPLVRRVAPTFTRPLSASIDPITTPPAPTPWDYGSYSLCVSINGGPNFKRLFRTCWCQSSGKVACRLALCTRLFPISQLTTPTPTFELYP